MNSVGAKGKESDILINKHIILVRINVLCLFILLECKIDTEFNWEII